MRIPEWVHPIVVTIAFLQATFCLVATVMVLAHYWEDKRFRHIILVASGNVLLTLLAAQSLIYGLYLQFWWRLPLSILAFYLVDHGIFNIFQKARERIHRQKD